MTRAPSSLFFWFALIIATSIGLYHTSDRVHALDAQLRTLNTQIADEQKSLHILKAEWVYLANPARVEAEAHRHLALAPTATKRVTELADLTQSVALRHDAPPAPIAVAQSAPVQETAPVAPEALHADAAPSHRHTIVASADYSDHSTSHINDHMLMQHATAVRASSTDSIGALIGSLSLKP